MIRKSRRIGTRRKCFAQTRGIRRSAEAALCRADRESHIVAVEIFIPERIGPAVSQAPVTNPEDSDGEYRSIEATLLATARGRWFLAEHGRRARRVDNALLQDAMSRLSASLREPTALAERLKSQLNLVRDAVKEVTAAVASSKGALAAPAIKGDAAQPSIAQSILKASEQVHELAWTLQGREGRDFDQRALEQIARQVVAIYALARQQAADTEYRHELLGKLAIAEERIAGLIETIEHEVNGGQGAPKAG